MSVVQEKEGKMEGIQKQPHVDLSRPSFPICPAPGQLIFSVDRAVPPQANLLDEG